MTHTFRQEPLSCACGWSGTGFIWTYEVAKVCPTCAGPATRVVCDAPNRAPSVIPDDIPGGLWVKHGLCNADGSPRRYDSKSAIREEASRRGFTVLGETPKDRGARWY